MDYNDQELLDYIHEGNEEAMQILYEKYDPYIQSKAKKLLHSTSNIGLDLNDLIQEGMIALNEAIKSFKPSKDATFYTFATTCIDRRMISSMIGAQRLKHKILNESISIEQELNDGSNISLENMVVNKETDPENVVLSLEREQTLLGRVKEVLTDFEYQVFELKYHNFPYREIAQILDKDSKAIDNALQRIKSKVSQILKELKKEEKIKK